MSYGLPSDFKELVRSRTSLVDLIGEAISLTPQRGGLDYVGLCPFHDDHNPSFHVYPDRQTYKCWVCDEGGDCFSFVQKREGIGFFEALEMLAAKANLEMPKQARRGKQSVSSDVFAILDWVRDECHQFLLADAAAADARKYLKGRGFTDESVRRFRVGYHPNQWDWLLVRARNRFPISDLLKAGVIQERRQGDGHRDAFLFIDRVVFPIHDQQGRCVAYGGRILPGSTQTDAAKYLNSSESDVFKKSQLVYAFDLAREAIRRTRTAIVVEGYTDCMVCHQFGFEQVVGTLGTALTEQHVGLLKRFADRVVLVYDGDQAGQDAAERALAKILAQDVDLRILTLPGGADPADYLASEGTTAFQEMIDQSAEAWEFKFQSSLRRFGSNTVDGRQRILDEMVRLLASVTNLSGSFREDLMISAISQRLKIDERVFRRHLGAHRNQRGSSSLRFSEHRQQFSDQSQHGSVPHISRKPTPNVDPKHRNQEQNLVEIVLVRPDLARNIQTEVGLDEFLCVDLKALLQTCYDLLETEDDFTFDRLLVEIEDPEMKRTALDVEQTARAKQVAEKLESIPSYLEQSIYPLTKRRDERALEVVREQISGSPSGKEQLDRDINSLRTFQETIRRRATQPRIQ